MSRTLNLALIPGDGIGTEVVAEAMKVLLAIAPLAEFKDKLFHIHAKDVTLNRVALDDVGRFDFPLRWHTPCIPGYGEIDWPHFFAALLRSGYDDAVCIEVEDDSFGGTLAGRKQALRVSRNMLKPFFG